MRCAIARPACQGLATVQRVKADVVCIGEALVDFLPSRRGQRVRDVLAWKPCLGGSPANVSVGVSRLGAKSALVGVTGDDEFGHFLKEGLDREGVNVSCLRQTTEGKTGLGFVSLTHSGERSFTFYRTRAAETFLGPEDTARAKKLIDGATIVHVGTNSLLHEAAREAVKAVVERRNRAGKLVSCDPNLRLKLWSEPELLRALLGELLGQCAIVKVSDDETDFITGTSSVEQALIRLEKRGVILPIVTLGPRGAAFRFRGQTRAVKANKVKVVDTTGAGDGFDAGVLRELSKRFATRKALLGAHLDELEAMVRFGCVVGSQVVRKLGAVEGLPRLRESLNRRTLP